MKNMSKMLWGILLIIMGITIALNSLEIMDINIFFSGWWTLFIIIPCFISLFDEKEGKTGNIIGLFIGIFLLLGAQGLLPFEIILKLIVPSILICIGLSLIFKNAIQKEIVEKIKIGRQNGLENMTATFSEQKFEREEEEFNGANLDAVFGSITLDLRDAKLKEETIIEASAIFGGITIITPKDATVRVRPTSIFGGTTNIASKKDAKKIIYINAFSLFGGIEIK